MDETIEELAQAVLTVALEVRNQEADLQAVMNEYWLDSYKYPAATARLKSIAERVQVRNPVMLDLNEVYRRLVLLTVKAIQADVYGDELVLDEAIEVVRSLIEYNHIQELHLQLANLGARSTFRFGGVEIHPIPNTGDTTEYDLKYKGPFGHGGPVDAVISYGVVRQAPGLDSKAWRNALAKVEEVLMILRGIGLPTLWGREWREAGVAGRGFGSGWVILRRQHRLPWYMSMAASPILAFMELEDMLSNYSESEIRLVERIFLKERPTKIERKALQALSWLGDATFPASNASKFAKLAIAFETAVGGEPSGDYQLREIGITEMLAERTAFLLGRDAENRLLWHKWVKTLYGSRSRVMHGEVEPISESDLSKWALLVWMATRAVLGRTREFSTVEDVARWVRKQRYTLPT